MKIICKRLDMLEYNRCDARYIAIHRDAYIEVAHPTCPYRAICKYEDCTCINTWKHTKCTYGACITRSGRAYIPFSDYYFVAEKNEYTIVHE